MIKKKIKLYYRVLVHIFFNYLYGKILIPEKNHIFIKISIVDFFMNLIEILMTKILKYFKINIKGELIDYLQQLKNQKKFYLSEK